MDSVILGRNIHRARKEARLSSDRLAELCDVTPSYMRQVEAGSKTPSMPLFVALCDQLRISPSVLLAGVVRGAVDNSMDELVSLCSSATPGQIKLIAAILKAALDNC